MSITRISTGADRSQVMGAAAGICWVSRIVDPPLYQAGMRVALTLNGIFR